MLYIRSAKLVPGWLGMCGLSPSGGCNSVGFSIEEESRYIMQGTKLWAIFLALQFRYTNFS